MIERGPLAVAGAAETGATFKRSFDRSALSLVDVTRR
jgi:hypothetical protein